MTKSKAYCNLKRLKNISKRAIKNTGNLAIALKHSNNTPKKRQAITASAITTTNYDILENLVFYLINGSTNPFSYIEITIKVKRENIVEIILKYN